MKSGIYKITNLLTGMCYIGSSIVIKHRLNCHKSLLRRNIHKNPYLQHSWNKHGEARFNFAVLEFCEKEKVIEREQAWLDIFKPYAPLNGYNIVKIAGSQLGLIHTQKSKDAISNTHKNKPKLKEHVAKIALAMIGKKRPDLAERNKANTGRKASEETKIKMSVARIGRKHSEEAKAKISPAHTGKPKSEEHKIKISQSRFGKKLSPESIAKRTETRRKQKRKSNS